MSKQSAARTNGDDGEFLATLSHELRTPIYGIVGLTQLALDEVLSPAVRNYLQTAQTSAETLLEVINEVLDCSTLKSGKFALELAPFALRPLVDGIVKSMNVHGADATLSLVSDVAQALPRTLIGDARRIRQVLTSLLAAVTQHMDLGQSVLRVSGEAQPSENVALRFEVSCPEVEISAADSQRMFTPFTQGGSADSSRQPRFSLGLAIASDLARLMGGRLGVDCSPGQGSTFYFDILLALGTMALEETWTPAIRDSRHLRVLLAEDTIANQKIVKSILTKRGHTVEIARNGREVVDKIGAKPFDIVLMDVQMPIMDGLQATSHIRAHELGRHVPIVAITAHVLPGDRERCLAAGMDGYLAKPISTDDLIKTVEMLSVPEEKKPCRAVGRPQTTPASSQPAVEGGRVFEIESVLKRLGQDRRIFENLVEFYIEDCPTLLEQVRAALRESDAKAIALAAHSLKGLAANFSAPDAVKVAAIVEKAGYDRELATVAESIEPLEREFARLTSALLPHRARSDGAQS